MTQHQAAAIYQALITAYGEPIWQAGEDPLETLIGTILSANTNDINSGRAFEQLMARFQHDWEAIRLAPLPAIIEAIRPAGMYNQKAPAIVAALERIWRGRGEYRLDFLADAPVTEALDYLTQFPGVGRKTASIVLLFCFNQAVFPVDTHIQRISQRLGLAGRKDSPDKIQAIWQALLPGQTYYALHLNLIRHGRQICQARQPRCEICVLQELCAYANQR
jgi:endonuclease-3